MITTKQIITAGEGLASKIKTAFYGDTPWSAKMAMDVGLKMSHFKKIARTGLTHLDEIAYLNHLTNFTLDDIRDAFIAFPQTIKDGVKCKDSQPSSIGERMARSMASN